MFLQIPNQVFYLIFFLSFLTFESISYKLEFYAKTTNLLAQSNKMITLSPLDFCFNHSPYLRTI